MSVELQNNKINIKLESSEYTLNLIGSTLTNWKINNKELIFNSNNSTLDGKSEYFGGIPLVFPQFALAKEPNPAHKLPIHGFARLLTFEYFEERTKIEDNSIELSLGLNSTQFKNQNIELFNLWPFEFNFTSIYTFTKDELKIEVKVDNLDAKELILTPLFHNYIKVNSIHSTELQGLEGIQYWDKNQTNQTTPVLNESNSIKINQGIDNIYINSATDNDKKITIIENDYKLELSASNLKDCVVWNPWAKGAEYGLCKSDFENFLCVELGQVIDPYKLQPKHSWNYSQSIKFIKN